MKVLLLHGGPGGTHEAFDCFDGYLPSEGIEYIYYDQLGSYYSDQPSDTSLWTTGRFVEEVEQVRKALHLERDNFYLLGPQMDPDVLAEIQKIEAANDFDNPRYMEWMAGEVQQGRFLFCPNGSHLSQYDDQKTYFEGVVKFIKDVDRGNF